MIYSTFKDVLCILMFLSISMSTQYEFDLHTGKTLNEVTDTLRSLMVIISAVVAVTAFDRKNDVSLLEQVAYLLAIFVWTVIQTWIYILLGWTVWRYYFMYLS